MAQWTELWPRSQEILCYLQTTCMFLGPFFCLSVLNYKANSLLSWWELDVFLNGESARRGLGRAFGEAMSTDKRWRRWLFQQSFGWTDGRESLALVREEEDKEEKASAKRPMKGRAMFSQ